MQGHPSKLCVKISFERFYLVNPMLIFLTIIHNLAQPYWDTLKKYLAKEDISSLTIIHSPNLIGHPIGIVILLASGLFIIPVDIHFYLFWFGMITIAAISLTLHIWGLVESKFFAVQILSKLGFVVSSVAAVLVIGEDLTKLQINALILGVIGISFFAWPQQLSRSSLVWDRGVIFVIISVILSGFAAVFYKMATFYTPDYATFLSGRFVGDMIGWSFIWIVISIVLLKRNPFNELIRCVKNKSGLILIVGTAASTLLSSWLIYQLPVTTFVMLGTLTIPAAYLFSRFKYKENMTPRMWIGTIFIIGSVGLFIL